MIEIDATNICENCRKELLDQRFRLIIYDDDDNELQVIEP